MKFLCGTPKHLKSKQNPYDPTKIQEDRFGQKYTFFHVETTSSKDISEDKSDSRTSLF